MEESLKSLVEIGKRKGYLTYSQVNDALPDDATSPEKLDQLLMTLEEQGIEVIDEADAEVREGVGAEVEEVAVVATTAEDEDEVRSTDAEDSSRSIDDPVRMYLSQMGEIPLLSREQEIALAKRIEVTRRTFRGRVLECDYALRLAV
ncbi:MAG: RNA polymerase sigma factor region1.1 domain-containing protein, partial [Planctomycetia bacterium]